MKTFHIDNCIVCGGSTFEKKHLCTDHTVSKAKFQLYACINCGFLFTQDIPGEDNIAPYYEAVNYISHSDTKEGLVSKIYHVARQIMLKRKSRLIENIVKKGTILDVGAGTGYFLNTMLSRGWKAEGIEPSPGARDLALQNFNLALKDNTELFNFEKNQFNVITLWHVLEHIYSPKKYLKHFNSILVKGGYLVIAVPNHSSLDAKIYRENWAAYDVPRHIWHFNPISMKELVGQHGFTLAGMKSMPLDAYYVSMLSEKYKSGKNRFLKSMINGFKSHVSSITAKEKCSSVIYIFKKQD